MSKTSQKTQTQEIDPNVRAEADRQFASGRELAAMGYNPYTGNSIADFSAGQKAAFRGVDAASAAFGMPTGAATGGPTGATTGAYGVSGFSNEATKNAESPLAPELQSALDQFFTNAGKPTPTQAPLSGGGGKK